MFENQYTLIRETNFMYVKFIPTKNWTGLDLVRKLVQFSYKIILYELEKVLEQHCRHARRGFLSCTVRKHVFVQGFVQRKDWPKKNYIIHSFVHLNILHKRK